MALADSTNQRIGFTMNGGFKALLSGLIACIVATTTVVLVRGQRDSAVDAVTIGGLTGGAVAVSVWLSENRRQSGNNVLETGDGTF